MKSKKGMRVKMEKKMKRKKGMGVGKVRGYFTVEASLVLPMVIGTILFVIYAQLYLYDRCLMDQETAMLSVQIVKDDRGNAEEKGQVLKKWQADNLTDKYVGWKMENLRITRKQDRISLEREGRLLTDHALWNANVLYENRVLRPASFLRLCRRCEDQA